MEIKLWDNFSKRRNSTKAPSSDDVPVVRSAVLKDGCSKTHPSFFIQGIAEYTYVQAFGRYYFVDNVEYDINDAEWLHCSIDVLATWKEKIGLTTAFIQYSSSNYNVNLLDDRVSQLLTKTRQRYVRNSIFVDDWNDGCFIITTVNTTRGACNYAVEYGALTEICRLLIDSSPTSTYNWAQMFGDAINSLIGVRYVPIPYSWFDDGGESDDIYLGSYNTEVNGFYTKGNIAQTTTIQIPWTYDDFRRSSEYTRFLLALPFIGVVEIRPETIMGQTHLRIHMVGNAVTGDIEYGIFIDDSPNEKMITSYSGKFGRQLPVAHGQVDLQGILSSGLVAGGAWTSALLGFSQPAAIGVMAGAAMKGIVSANMQDFTVVGALSGAWSEMILSNYEMVSITTDTRTDPSSLTNLYGRPSMVVAQISTLTGYVQTIGFSIDIDELDEVKKLINQAMDSGVYLE